MATFVVFIHPITILTTDFTNQDNLTNDLLIINSENKQIFSKQMITLGRKSLIFPSMNKILQLRGMSPSRVRRCNHCWSFL